MFSFRFLLIMGIRIYFYQYAVLIVRGLSLIRRYCGLKCCLYTISYNLNQAILLRLIIITMEKAKANKSVWYQLQRVFRRR